METRQKRKIDELNYNDDQVAPAITSEPNEAFLVTKIDGELCERCLGIDLKEIFSREIVKSSFVMNLGSVAALQKSRCQMCRIFASCVPSDLAPEMNLLQSEQVLLKSGMCHLRVFSASWAFTGFSKRERLGEELQQTNLLAVVPGEYSAKEPTYFVVSRMRSTLTETGYLALESSINAQSICGVRALNPLVFDFAHAREWISYCGENHRTRCSRKTFPELRRFHVFDCRIRKVVDAPEGCRYVALSYVWGKADSSCSPQTPTMAEYSQGHLEKVIEDSVTVTQGLGLHYLWVDRICIDQSDDVDKRHQISQMDLIYANSALTIIAAAGNGPDHGLPGINGTLRIQQRRYLFRSERLISTLPSGRYSVQQSKWHTRGWTFQECVLSTRRLIFTESQVLFECNGMHCSEVLSLPLDLMHTKNKRTFDTFARDMSALSVKTPGSEPTEYMQYLHDFSLRELTYREDALNAFQGVLNAFRRAKRPVHNFWGVPIFLSDNSFDRGSAQKKIKRSMSTRFAISLFWYASGAPWRLARMNTACPSWSWAAWDGPIRYTRQQWLGPDIFSDVRVWLEDTHKETYSLDEINFEPGMCALQDTYSKTIRVEGWTINVDSVGLHFTASEKAYLAKGKPFWLMEPQDGIHVSFSMGSQGTVYSELRSYDPSWAASSERTLIGFLPYAYTQDHFFGTAMLLEKVDDHYERVGLFYPSSCWSRDEAGNLQRNEDPRCEGLDSTRQTFWLG